MKQKIAVLVAVLVGGGAAFAVAQFQHNKHLVNYEIVNQTNCCYDPAVSTSGPVVEESIVVTATATGETRTLVPGETWFIPRVTPVKPPFTVQSTTGLCSTGDVGDCNARCFSDGCIWIGNGAMTGTTWKWTITKRCPPGGCAP